jgi:hypothetical protein
MSETPVLPNPPKQIITTVPGIYNPVSKDQATKSLFPALEPYVVSELQYQSRVFQRFPVIPVRDIKNNGFTFTYSWMRTKSEAGAAFRAINGRVTESSADYEMAMTEIAMLETSFAIDHRLTRTGAIIDPISFNWSENVKSMAALVNEAFIRGDPSLPADAAGIDRCHGPGTFKGLNALAHDIGWHVWTEPLDLTDLYVSKTGSEFYPGTPGSIRNTATAAKDQLMTMLSDLTPEPTMLIGNNHVINALSRLGEALGLLTREKNDFGQTLTYINGIELIDIGRGMARNTPIIKTVKSNDTLPTAHPDYVDDVYENYAFTKLIACSAGPEEVHLIAPETDATVVSLPDWTKPREEVNRAWIETMLGVVVKNRNCLGIFDCVYVPKKSLPNPAAIVNAPQVDPVTYLPL